MPLHERRVLVIGADGLRPDLVTPELMPTYARLLREGAHVPDFYAAYPPHTRVNMSTFTTGRRPGGHGVLANLLLDPIAGGDGLVDTSDDERLLALAARDGRSVLDAPTLGDRLHAQGARLAVAASSSPGASLLWNPHHPHRILNPASPFGQPDLLALHEKLGPVPPERGRTRYERARWATDALLDVLIDDPDNRVLVLWLSEPDASQHFYGLGSPEAFEAQRRVDACVARVFDALDARGLRDDFDVLLLSDHGHSTVDAHRSLGEHLEAAPSELGLEGRFRAVGDLIHAASDRAPSADEVAALAAWLLEREWCDVVFSGSGNPVPGTVPLEAVQGPFGATARRRAPLLAVAPAWSDAFNEHGVPGRVRSLTSLASLRSTHGSASPFDLRAFCLGVGPSFRAGTRSPLAAGAIDVAPTICALLGIDADPRFDGRPLAETLRTSPDPVPAGVEITSTPAAPGRMLRSARVGRADYFLGSAPTEPGAPARDEEGRAGGIAI